MSFLFPSDGEPWVVLDVDGLKLGFTHGDLVSSPDRQPQWIAGQANEVGGGAST